MDYIDIIDRWIIIGLLSSLLLLLIIILSFSNSARNKERQIRLKYKNLFDNMNEGFALHRVICDEEGKPVDYVFLEVNKAFENLTGLKADDIKGKNVKDVIPSLEESWIETYGDVALNRNKISFENYSHKIGKHFKVSAYSPKYMEFASLFIDITDQVLHQEKIDFEKKLLEAVLDDATLGYWDNNMRDGKTYYSPSYKVMLGYSENEDMPEWNFLMRQEDIEMAKYLLNKHIESKGKIPFYIECRYKHRSGRIIWVLKSGRIIEWDENGKPVRLIGCLMDITNRKNLENTLLDERNLFQTTLHSIVDGVVSIDRNGIIQLVNKSAEMISGYKKEELIGNNILAYLNLVDENNDERIITYLDDFFDVEVNFRDDLSFINKNGNIVPIEFSVAQIINKDGEVEGAVMVFRDVTEKREGLSRISYLSYHDQLTGLNNRYYFEEQLQILNKEENLPLTLGVIDVNGLKLTNDAFGHATGDELLKMIAEVLKSEFRLEDIVTRAGGDEFVILMPKTETSVAEEYFKNIYRALEKVEFNKIVPSVSIGWATKVSVLENIEDIYNKAEEHMYRKKIAEGQSMRSRTIQVIMNTLNEKNKRERIHSQNVGKISRKIAELMKFDSEVVKEIELAGLLHDIGKIAIDDNILNKNGILTEEEYKKMKMHPERGYHIIKTVDAYTKLADYILSHHERWDGKGYPRGLAGDSIPLISRIICVADAYEAMTANRPYRKGMSHEEAIQELKRCSGIQFDPYIVATFVNYCKDEEW